MAKDLGKVSSRELMEELKRRLKVTTIVGVPMTINGVLLNAAQEATVRVALDDFLGALKDPDRLGTDEHGRRMVVLYKACAQELSNMLVESANAVPSVHQQ